MPGRFRPSFFFWFGVIWLLSGGMLALGTLWQSWRPLLPPEWDPGAVPPSRSIDWLPVGLGSVLGAAGGVLVTRDLLRMRAGVPPSTPGSRAFPPWSAWRNTGIAVVAIIVAQVLVEAIPPLKAAAAWIEESHSRLLAVALPIFSVGFALFMVGILWLVARSGRRSRGEQFTFRELKTAAGAGILWADRTWRRRIVTLTGALLMSLGLLAVCFLFVPAGAQLLLAGAAAFAAIRLVRVLWRA